MRSADALLVLCPTLFPLVRRFNRRTILVSAAVDVDHFNPEGVQAKLGESDRIQVVYAGNFLVWQGCELLLEAANIILSRSLPYDFTFIGSFGREDKLLHKWEKWIAVGYFHFIDLVKYDVIPIYLRSADILTIPRPFLLSTHFAFPNKLGDYMASGRAILATNLKPHRYAIQDGKNGVLCRPTPSSIAEGLLRLQDSMFRQVLGENARITAVQNYNAKGASQSVYSVLQEVVNA
jgi:glycosyltransferase involved in cell wall biosynthesis